MIARSERGYHRPFDPRRFLLFSSEWSQPFQGAFRFRAGSGSGIHHLQDEPIRTFDEHFEFRLIGGVTKELVAISAEGEIEVDSSSGTAR